MRMRSKLLNSEFSEFRNLLRMRIHLLHIITCFVPHSPNIYIYIYVYIYIYRSELLRLGAKSLVRTFSEFVVRRLTDVYWERLCSLIFPPLVTVTPHRPWADIEFLFRSVAQICRIKSFYINLPFEVWSIYFCLFASLKPRNKFL